MALIAADADFATTEIGAVANPATRSTATQNNCSVEVGGRGIHPGGRMRIRQGRWYALAGAAEHQHQQR